ncbi:MAG: hypothetical protein Q9202_004762 [Teloschistes flavicans]
MSNQYPVQPRTIHPHHLTHPEFTILVGRPIKRRRSPGPRQTIHPHHLTHPEPSVPVGRPIKRRNPGPRQTIHPHHLTHPEPSVPGGRPVSRETAHPHHLTHPEPSVPVDKPVPSRIAHPHHLTHPEPSVSSGGPVPPRIIHPHHLTHPELTVRVVAPTVPPPLPPSVEAAYKKKCVQLKKRMIELDEANDAARRRKMRNIRFINKMRLERAYLLEKLCELQKKNGEAIEGLPTDMDEDSEGSSEGPPTFARNYSGPRRQPIINGHPTISSNLVPQDGYPGLAPRPLDSWNEWVRYYIISINPSIQQVSEADQLTAARGAWAALSRHEQESWHQGCEKRSYSYENLVRELEGRPQIVRPRGGDEDSAAEGEDEGDDDMEGAAAGGFTAVNG